MTLGWNRSLTHTCPLRSRWGVASCDAQDLALGGRVARPPAGGAESRAGGSDPPRPPVVCPRAGPPPSVSCLQSLMTQADDKAFSGVGPGASANGESGRWWAARAVLTPERAEKPKISFETSCAAVSEPGCDRLDALGPCPRPGRPEEAVDGVDAHGDEIAQPARPQAAQVAPGTGRTDRGGRSDAEVATPTKFLC